MVLTVSFLPQMSIGYYEQHIGYLKYTSDSFFDNPAVLWSFVGGGILLLLIITTVSVVAVLKRRKSTHEDNKDKTDYTQGATMSTFASPSQVKLENINKPKQANIGRHVLRRDAGNLVSLGPNNDGYLAVGKEVGESTDSYLEVHVDSDWKAQADSDGYLEMQGDPVIPRNNADRDTYLGPI